MKIGSAASSVPYAFRDFGVPARCARAATNEGGADLAFASWWAGPRLPACQASHDARGRKCRRVSLRWSARLRGRRGSESPVAVAGAANIAL